MKKETTSRKQEYDSDGRLCSEVFTVTKEKDGKIVKEETHLFTANYNARIRNNAGYKKDTK